MTHPIGPAVVDPGAVPPAPAPARLLRSAWLLRWRRLTDFHAAWVDPLIGPARRLPDAVIIGAQKSGTTSLYHHLTAHPGVVASRTKEVHFFDVNFRRGLGWYRYHFPPSRTQPPEGVWLESSPYYLFHPCVPQRMRERLPGARLIVMLRDPVSRAYSHYWHERSRGRELLSFADALAAEAARLDGAEADLAAGRVRYSYNHQRYSYFARGLYARQIRRWLDHFPAEQFLFVDSGVFFSQPETEMARITDFLGLERRTGLPLPRANVGRYDADIDPDTAARLRAAYAEHDEELARLTGRRFSWMGS